MNLFRRIVFVALAAVFVGALACGGDGTGPGASAASVTGVAGDNQTAPTGTTLSFPLSFIALNSSGQPAQGVRVTWSVSPTGGASFSPHDSTTDINGAVSTTVTTASFIGNITISAKVTGVANVVYHATVLDPCSYLAPLAIGGTVDGALTASDCAVPVGPNAALFYDFYALTVPTAQANVRINMHAGANDTYLVLWSGASPFPFIAFNDDSILNWEGARNSQLDIILPPGDYIVGASAFAANDLFAYSLAPATRSASMNGCREVWVMSGVSLTDDISAQDCSDSSATPHHYDVARIFVRAGSVLSVSEQSTAMNPSLALYKVVDTLPSDTTVHAYVRELVASNDDSSATNTNAFIRFAADTSNYYDIIIGTSTGGETGAYTFTVDTTTTPSPHASAPRPSTDVRRPAWWRLRGDLRRSKP